MKTAMNQVCFFALALLTVGGVSAKNRDTRKNNIEYETYHNDRYGYTVEYPNFLIPQSEAANQDGQKFVSENQKIKFIVYYEYKNDFNSDGEQLSIDEAYQEDLKLKEGIFNKKLESQRYIIEYKMDDILHTDYLLRFGETYFNTRFEYPETEKERMRDIIEHVINSLKVDALDADVDESEDNDSAGGFEDPFLDFLDGFLKDCYWGKNINNLLREKDKTLAKYIDSKMDVRRYYAPGTTTKLGTRNDDFGFAPEDDFTTRPRAIGDLIFEYVNDDSTPCELIYSNINVIYYISITSIPDEVVNSETFETRPVKIAYTQAEIMAVYIPNAYGNPRGYYFIHTPNGWKFAFVDDTLCGA
ncbi:MAG: hypothetical protein RBR35_11470 [Salinivirgaceae bacterium]|nr:hypothetical protein [Salinivirgaceae bacterium]MDY0281167.1 hypothetical protein [Salinivirgaceae bacterium]